MQPCSREMQGINSFVNSSQISLPDLQNNNQIQNSHMNNNHQHQHHHPQLNHTTTTPHFDPPPNDDFLEQMLSNLPSCSWPDINPNKPLWDPNHSLHISNTNSLNGPDVKPHDLSDETAPSGAENVAFPYDEHASLASKFRNHQISGASPTTKAAAAALMLQQQQLLLSRNIAGADSGLLQMPLSLGGNDVVDASPFKSPNQGAEASVQALYNGFAGSLHGTGQASNQSHHFQQPQGSPNPMQGQNFAASGVGGATNQAPASGAAGGAPAQPKQRVRARRGQATDPHSIAERLRRERIAERMKALQELVPNANKTDKASMLDEIIDYVKFLQLQVKVLSMSRLGGAAAVAPLVADLSSEGGGDCIQTNGNGNGVGALPRNSNGNQTTASTSNDSLTMTEHQVAKLMEEDMGSAMQYLQGKGLCLMPISLATAISTATCHTRNPLINGGAAGGNNLIPNTNGGGVGHANPAVRSNGEGPSSPNMSVLTVQSATAGNDGAVKDATSVSKP